MTTGPGIAPGARSACRSRVTMFTLLPSCESSFASSKARRAEHDAAASDARDVVERPLLHEEAVDRAALATLGWTPKTCDRCACGSRSMPSGRCPRRAIAASRFSAVVVLPTPPFWLIHRDYRQKSASTRPPRPAPASRSARRTITHREYRHQHQRDPIPLEKIHRRVEGHADAAGADQSDDRGSRTLMSQRNSAIDQNAGSTCGQ